MNKFSLILLFILFSFFKAYPQIDILQLPTEQEKTEVNRILAEYSNFMSAIGDTIKGESAKATLHFVKDLANINVQVYYDLDTLATNDSYVKLINPYPQKLHELLPGKINISLSDISLSKVKFDKIRRYYYVEVNARKRFEWEKVSRRILKDSVLAKDSVVLDTLKSGFDKKLTFYIKFDKVNTISKNFKLLTIARQGGEPLLDPIPAAYVWWLEMDPQWKTYFREKYKLEEYPTPWEIEKLTNQQELDISNKTFKTLAPLSKMVFLQKLNCSGTPVQDLESISNLSGLIELDISKSQIKSLNGVEKLTNLQELKCSSLQLESIEPLKGLTNLVKLDISDNDLEDISPLAGLVNLKELDFSSNVKLEKINVVKNFILLEKLSFAKVKAGSLDPLKNLINLIHLNCFNTEITTLEPIRNLQKIIFLNVDHTPITTLEPIKNYKFVTDLSLATSSVIDLTPIKDFNYLRTLNVSNTQITTLGPAIKLPYIRELQCQMTKVPKDEVARFKKNHPGCQISFWY